MSFCHACKRGTMLPSARNETMRVTVGRKGTHRVHVAVPCLRCDHCNATADTEDSGSVRLDAIYSKLEGVKQ
jgi:hypothetical protein